MPGCRNGRPDSRWCASRVVRVVALGAVASTVLACSSSDDDVTSSPATASTIATTTPSTRTASAGTDAAAQQALDDVVGWLADPTTLDPARFTEAFLQQVRAEQVGQVLAAVGAGPWRVVGVESPSPRAVAARLEGAGPAVVVQLAVDADGLIESLLFQPGEPANPPVDLVSLVERLRTTAPIAGFLRADVAADGTCAPVAALTPGERLPIGSAFKLYVLGAVAAGVEAGEVTWDQQRRAARRARQLAQRHDPGRAGGVEPDRRGAGPADDLRQRQHRHRPPHRPRRSRAGRAGAGGSRPR